MNISSFIHTEVSESGIVKKGGAVVVNGRFSRSAPGGGCGAGLCSCSDGHWVSKVFPRTADGRVFGYMVKFSSEQEMENADLVAIEESIVSDPRISLDVAEAVSNERKSRLAILGASNAHH